MISFRSCLLFWVAVWTAGSSAWTQEGAAPSGGTGGNNAASLLSDSPFTVEPNASSSGTNAPTPSFRTGAGSTMTDSTERNTPTGAASTFGSEADGGTTLTRAAPTTFTLPGEYGRGPLSFTVGEGRLGRPKFRISGRASVGYDDNIFQTPTRPAQQKTEVLVSPGTPPTTTVETVPSGDPLVLDGSRLVDVPGTDAEFRTETIPSPQRLGSFILGTGVDLDVQIATRRTLFTFDLKGGVDYYLERSENPEDYTGSLALIYLRKLTGRAQVTALASVNYQSQPDFSQANAPTNNSGGSYMIGNGKLDLSYRLTPRFSTVTSVNYDVLYSIEKSEQAADYRETTFGTELRYLFSPRLTLLGELRYGSSLHPASADLDTTSYFLLAGGELTLGRRSFATLRIGQELQTYSETGQKGSSPYIETTLSYRLTRGTTVAWNARYGFEESGSNDSESTVARSGLSLSQIFSPRLQASLALNVVHSVTSTTSEVPATSLQSSPEMSAAEQPASTVEPVAAVPAPVTPPATAGAPAAPAPALTPEPEPEPAPVDLRRITTESVQDTVDATLSFRYTLSRRWSFNLSYSYTTVIGPQDDADYYRQRVFLGAEYLF